MMDEFLGYDDKLEIANEFGVWVGNTLYGGTQFNDDGQVNNDSEEYRWHNQ